ncbi:MAG: hypothetical protein Q7R52_03040 [archaeon]|nr:hypothetical protein [archaeon]
MSEVVKEIRRQLVALGVPLKRKVLVKLDDNTLRVHTPGILGKIGGRSVDIKYDHGQDLYDVSIHELNNKTFKIKTCRSKGVFVDSLPDYFNKNITKGMKCKIK